ncbi:MAG: hypothetical protein R3E60_02135 [Alphaproteobacteria bacterium]
MRLASVSTALVGRFLYYFCGLDHRESSFRLRFLFVTLLRLWLFLLSFGLAPFPSVEFSKYALNITTGADGKISEAELPDGNGAWLPFGWIECLQLCLMPFGCS